MKEIRNEKLKNHLVSPKTSFGSVMKFVSKICIPFQQRHKIRLSHKWQSLKFLEGWKVTLLVSFDN